MKKARRPTTAGVATFRQPPSPPAPGTVATGTAATAVAAAASGITVALHYEQVRASATKFTGHVHHFVAFSIEEL